MLITKVLGILFWEVYQNHLLPHQTIVIVIVIAVTIIAVTIITVTIVIILPIVTGTVIVVLVPITEAAINGAN